MACVKDGVQSRVAIFIKTKANSLTHLLITNMIRTTYSHLDTRELIQFALCRDTRSDLELELAQRLELAIDMIEEDDDS